MEIPCIEECMGVVLVTLNGFQLGPQGAIVISAKKTTDTWCAEAVMIYLSTELSFHIE